MKLKKSSKITRRELIWTTWTSLVENWDPKMFVVCVNLIFIRDSQAFRQLSHRFHGKGAGKAKNEKKLRKIAEEMQVQKMISTDTPLGTSEALQQRQKEAGKAFVVIGVGNRK